MSPISSPKWLFLLFFLLKVSFCLWRLLIIPGCLQGKPFLFYKGTFLIFLRMIFSSVSKLLLCLTYKFCLLFCVQNLVWSPKKIVEEAVLHVC